MKVRVIVRKYAERRKVVEIRSRHGKSRLEDESSLDLPCVGLSLSPWLSNNDIKKIQERKRQYEGSGNDSEKPHIKKRPSIPIVIVITCCKPSADHQRRYGVQLAHLI